jgi:hypothetical protein
MNNTDMRRPNTVTRSRDVRIGTGVTGTRPGPENGRKFSATDGADETTSSEESRRTRQRTNVSSDRIGVEDGSNTVTVPHLNDDDLSVS